MLLMMGLSQGENVTHSLIFVFPSGVLCSIVTISLIDRNFLLFSPSSILVHSSGLLGSASSVPASHACVLLKTFSGSTISCLLSSSPVSWSGRLDSASARPFFFPGRCTNVKLYSISSVCHLATLLLCPPGFFQYRRFA